MLRFEAYRQARPIETVDLAGAYLFGQDNIPVRADLAATNHRIRCTKRMPGPAGLTLLWDTGSAGRYLLATTRLPEREEPYSLNLELARAQIAHLYRKREDWGLFEHAHALREAFHRLRALFVQALQANLSGPAGASVLADEALTQGLLLGEKIALFHAERLLHRHGAEEIASLALGCQVELDANDPEYQTRLQEAFDFIHVPTTWKTMEPNEREFCDAPADTWCHWAAHRGKAIHAGPLVSFDFDQMPGWLHLYRSNFASLQERIFAHVRRVVERYHRQVRVWHVVAGLNARNPLDLSFEQILELTRNCCQWVKTLAPAAQVVIELARPWGEYYAHDPRTIPPLLYADMIHHGEALFDAFALPLAMGIPAEGYFVRDLLQISSLLDEFLPHGKGIHLIACGVPSSPREDRRDAWSGTRRVLDAGKWHTPWTEKLQAQWLRSVLQLAASKPGVERFCWRHLADGPGQILPHSGLCRSNARPKQAFREFSRLHKPGSRSAAPPLEGIEP